MNEEQKEKWYKSFTKEQLIERCEYLQRSCERKENTINDREMENTKLETKIEKLKEENYELYLQCKQYEDKEEDLENEIERLKQDNEYLNKVNIELSSRNSKAIEYMENNFISYEDSRTFGQLGEEIDIQVKEIRELLNILKGNDKE